MLRLSALGDCVNIVPVVHTLQKVWPQTRISWLIGATEARLVGGLPGVEFIVYDKRSGAAGRRAVRRTLADRRFDVLCHMHAGLRANLVSREVPADLRLGFDPARSRDLHGWFVDRRIKPPAGRHVVDGYFAFLESLGIEQRVADWSLPVSDQGRAGAAQRLPDGAPWLLISPCSSHRWRDWRAERYAAVAAHADAALGMRVAVIGGVSPAERRTAQAITAAAQCKIHNLVGDAPLELLVALMQRAAVLITPDSGPAHIGNAARIPVIALHAATEAARSGPYTSLPWCVDRYDAAARRFLRKPAAQLKWGTKIERRGVMDLIEVADVVERLEAVMKERGHGACGVQ